MNPIIVALDLPSVMEAREMVRRVGDAAGHYKVGMELYAAAGISFVEELLAEGHRVFLDLKFYDIPETVKRATAVVAAKGVHLLTVHGSKAVMQAAVESREGSSLRLLGVTVLTSFDKSDLEDMGYPCAVEDLVRLRIEKAFETKMDGIVCSPLEARLARQIMGPAALAVTPGVRSAGAARGDQKRVATPAEAIRNGATHIVIGRQITRAQDPRSESMRVLEEIQNDVESPAVP